MNDYHHCGVCGLVTTSETEMREHIAEKDDDGETHDGEPWEVSSDDIVCIFRSSEDHPWYFHGSWRFGNDVDFSADENIGWAVRQHFRGGACEVRVMFRRDAEHVIEQSRAPKA